MSEYWKTYLWGLFWTACEAMAAVIAAQRWSSFAEVNWDVLLFAVFVGCLLYVVKTKVFGVPNMEPAEELTDEVVEAYAEPEENPVPEDYDDLHVDDDDDDEDAEDEVEQEK